MVTNDTENFGDVNTEKNFSVEPVERPIWTPRVIQSTVGPMPAETTLASRIEAVRAKLGATQKALAEQVGKTQGTYAAWIVGKAEPSLGTITKIAALGNVSPAWLAFGIGEPHLGEQAAAPPPSPSAMPEGAFMAEDYQYWLEVALSHTGALDERLITPSELAGLVTSFARIGKRYGREAAVEMIRKLPGGGGKRS